MGSRQIRRKRGERWAGLERAAGGGTGKGPARAVMARLRHATGLVDLNPVHRLDRETAGLVVFNLRQGERDAYHRLFRDRAVQKVYEAIAPLGPGPWPRTVHHRLAEPPGEDFMQMQVVPGEPNAETWVNLVEPLTGAGQGWASSLERPGDDFQVGVDEALLFSNSDRVQRELLALSNDRLLKDTCTVLSFTPDASPHAKEFNDKVVRQFMLASIIWGIVGMAVGVLIAAQLAS